MRLWKARLVAAAIMTISAGGVGLVKQHEGKVNQAYLDPVKVVTVCYGHTATARMGQVFSDEACEKLLRSDLQVAEAGVRRLVTVPLTQNTYDALVSFTFNVGEGNLARSTLLKLINAGDYVGACKELPKWVYAKGVYLRGLAKRRADEMALCLKGLV